VILAAKLASRVSPINAYLTCLWPVGIPDDSVLTVWNKSTGQSYHSATPRSAETKLRMWTRRSEVYLCVGARRAGLGKEHRGSTDEVTHLPAFYADIDVGDKSNGKRYPSSIEEAVRALSMFPAQYTMLIASGTGLHVYWAFEKPVDCRDPARRHLLEAELRAFGAGLTAHFSSRGYDIDNVFDLARLLRVPGCLNHKASVGEALTETKLLEYDETARYESPQALNLLASVELADEPVVERTSRTSTSDDDLAEILERPGVTEEQMQRFMQRSEISSYLSGERKGKPSISEGDQGLIIICLREGLNLGQIGQLLDIRRSASGEKPHKIGDQQYLELSVRNSLKHLGGVPEIVDRPVRHEGSVHRHAAAYEAINHCRFIPNTKASSRLVLCILASFPDDGDVVAVAQAEISRQAHVNARTVSSCIKELEREGCISVIDRSTAPGKNQRIRLEFLSSDHRH